MKHEKFRLFEIPGNALIQENLEIEKFLTSGITPKSLSIHYGRTNVVCLGYMEEKTEEQYHLLKVEFVPPVGNTKETIQAALCSAAEQVDGVICQDVHFELGLITIIFLTYK